MYYNEEHKKIVEERGDKYIYIGSYKSKETTIDGKKSKLHIRVKCPYCGKEYDIRLDSFINRKYKCKNCCNKYENSFAYYIQQELKESLNKYWDWEKNDELGINPYCVAPQSNKKVYIKCDKTDYHGSYLIMISNFYKGRRCPYCTARHGKVHPKDSFGQWLIEEFGDEAIEKYWSPKNIINPFKLNKTNTTIDIWIYCQEKDYHNDNEGYKTTANSVYLGNRCPYCNPFASHKVHPLDSFGSLYPDKAKYWSKNNNKSPYEVTPKKSD